MQLKMTKQDLTEFLADVFDQVADDFTVEDLAPNYARIRLNVGEKHLRPGGTVSGPSMFALADCAVYMAVLAMIGPKALAVTTNASMDFMRKPAANTDLIAETRILKLGKRLAVGDVLIFSEGLDKPVAHSTMTYSIPD
jgi:uncharacterized protein (TIGR00369 family)